MKGTQRAYLLQPNHATLRLQRGHARVSVDSGRMLQIGWAAGLLQRGHARVSVDSAEKIAALRVALTLQRGHARVSVERPSSCTAGNKSWKCASTGPRSRERGEPVVADGEFQAVPGFNGATLA